MIKLTQEQILSLKTLHKTITKRKTGDRIKVILMLNDGYSYEEIQKVLLISESSIRRYENTFINSGIESLIESNYKGGISKINHEQERELVIHLENNLYNTSNAIVKYIYEHYGIEYTPDGLVILLHRIGFSYKKTKNIPSKADAEKQKIYLSEYHELRNSIDNTKETIYFIDAVHPTHNSMPTHAWIKTGKEKYVKSNTGRKRININGAYSPIDNSVVIREDDTINSDSTIKLFKQLENKHPNLEKIHVICDNARYYYSIAVRDYIATSKIQMHYLPSYSPNLNLIERLWKFMKKNVIYNKYYEKYDVFKLAIIKFFENINEYKPELQKLMSENFHLFNTC